MDLKSLLPLLLTISVVLTVISLGLEAKTGGVLTLLREPKRLLPAMLAMFVIMPAVAIILALAFDLHPAVKIALVALALSPVPPILPKKQLKAGGSSEYVFGLLVAAGILSIVYIPLALEVVEKFSARSLQVSPGSVAKVVLITILAPLGIGIVLKKIAPAFAERIARPLMLVGTVLLLIGLVVALVGVWPAMVSLVGNGTVLVFVVLAVVGLAAGHLLGGPDAGDRTVLAFATSTRHPGVALAIAGANFPEEKLVLPAVLMFLLVSGILSAVYTKWRGSQRVSGASTIA